MKQISVIIPCYNSEKTIAPLVESIISILSHQFELQIILANDGSQDNTWQEITGLCERYSFVIGLDLSRNYGQQSARMAAISRATGEYAVFMDDDGQHDPRYIPDFVEELERGYDIVYADFGRAKQPLWRRIGSSFRSLCARILEGSSRDLHPTAYFALKKYLIKGLQKYPSPTPSVFGYLQKSTRNISTIPVVHLERENGHSGYTFHKLVSAWLNEMIGFSIIPLRISSVLGIVSAFAGFLVLIITIILRIWSSDIPVGYTSIVAITLFFGGVILMMLGIIGEYLGRICMTINRTPQYMIRTGLNDSEKTEDDLNV